jgi:hypothetical protein
MRSRHRNVQSESSATNADRAEDNTEAVVAAGLSQGKSGAERGAPTAAHFFSLAPSSVRPEMEAAFFSMLKMRNGTFKKTQPSRFSEIEAAFGPAFRERATRIRAALDVGVSSGLTTIEFADFLSAIGAHATVTGTDLFMKAHLVELGRHIRVLADAEGWPLQYDLGGVVFRPWTRRLDYVTQWWLPLRLAHSLSQRRVRNALSRGEGRAVSLVSPRLAGRDDVALLEDDVLRRSPALVGKFDVVRAANILNRNYFSSDRLRRAVSNLTSYMRGPGALLLVTRTDGARNNAGTLFELGQNGSFKPIGRIGGGSEIEALISSLPPANDDRSAGATSDGEIDAGSFK